MVDRRVVNRGTRKTPGRFATEVITADTAPQLQVHYKSSKAKAYLKEGKALRVETTINNAVGLRAEKDPQCGQLEGTAEPRGRDQRPLPRGIGRRPAGPA